MVISFEEFRAVWNVSYYRIFREEQLIGSVYSGRHKNRIIIKYQEMSTLKELAHFLKLLDFCQKEISSRSKN